SGERLDNKPWQVRARNASMFTFPCAIDAQFVIDGKLVSIPKGTMLGRLDFYPNHKLLYAPENVSSALSQFIEGFDVIFHCIDRVQSSDIKMQPPSYLIGDTTEKRMARFVQRIGFDVINFNEVGYTVIGETDPVRRKHAALQARRFK